MSKNTGSKSRLMIAAWQFGGRGRCQSVAGICWCRRCTAAKKKQQGGPAELVVDVESSETRPEWAVCVVKVQLPSGEASPEVTLSLKEAEALGRLLLSLSKSTADE